MQAVFTAIGQFFTDLLSKIAAVVQWCIDLVVQVFVDLWEFCTDVPVWAFDGLLGVVVTALQAMDFEIPDSTSASFAALPAEVLNVMGLLGVGYALGIVATAIVIRLGLQLIPFVRLGS